MLHYSTIEPRTLEILKEVMAVPELSDFYLVGGTALSLYYGHRLSIDLDFFSTKDFQPEELAIVLEKQFPNFAYTAINNVGIFGFIGDVKVDFVKHHYFELIGPPSVSEGIRLYSIADISAMKIAAILKRGVKKDFWDIAEILQHLTLSNVIELYRKKYPSQQLLISVPHALIYFEDAEESEPPICLKSQTWEEVKLIIKTKVTEYLQ